MPFRAINCFNIYFTYHLRFAMPNEELITSAAGSMMLSFALASFLVAEESNPVDLPAYLTCD